MSLPLLLRLSGEFAQIGVFAIGGGLATLPFLRQLAEKTGWFNLHDLANMIAISESTPGPIGINMATYTGYAVAGVPGALVATVGIVFPALVLVLLVARFLSRFRQSKLVDDLFYGLRPASVGLICAAAFSVLTISLLNAPAYALTKQLSDLFQWKSILLAAALYIAMKKWSLHPAVYIGLSAVIGVVFQFAGK